MRVSLLLLVCVTCVVSVTDQDCSRGDLDFLCEHVEECADYMSQAEDTLCKTLSKDIGTTPPYASTEYRGQVTGTVWGTDRVTRGRVTGRLTGVTGNEEMTQYATVNMVRRQNTVTVKVKPTIDSFRTVKSNSDDQLVQAYTTVRFECRATGAPTPTVSILKVEDATREQSTFKEQESEVMSSSFVILELQDVDESNAGFYRCMACNYWGCVEDEIQLTVRDLCKDVSCDGGKICVADFDLNEAVCLCPDLCAEEMTADVGCSNYCTSYFSTCQMKNDACEAGRSDEYIIGEGMCANNDQNSLKKTVSVTYNGAPAPSTLSLTVQTGASLTLECSYQYTTPITTAGVQPGATYKWFKVVNGKAKVVGTQSTLTLSSLRAKDKGNYHCKVTTCMQYKDKSDRVVIEIQAGKNKNYRTDSCYVYGDPHIITFDKRQYNFMGQCDYVLAMDCEAATWFVYGRMRPCTGRFKAASCLESVTIYYNSDVIELMRGWLINHFGKKISPKNYPNNNLQIGDTFSVKFNGRYLTIEILLSTYEDADGNTVSKKVRVIWDGFVGVEVQAPYDGRTCGLCGNNDGVSDGDDFTPSGRVVIGKGDKYNVFGDSWKVDKYGRCPATPAAASNKDICGRGYAAVKAECAALFGISAFSQCSIDTAPYISGCIYDTCAGLVIERTDSFSPPCITALAYAKACENQKKALNSNDQYDDLAGTSVSGWEGQASCPSQKDRFTEILNSGCPQLSKAEDDVTGTLIV